MAVVIRLARYGTKHKPFYRVVVADQRYCKEGRHLEVVGTYDPKNKQVGAKFKKERVTHWVAQGARPTATVSRLLRQAG